MEIGQSSDNCRPFVASKCLITLNGSKTPKWTTRIPLFYYSTILLWLAFFRQPKRSLWQQLTDNWKSLKIQRAKWEINWQEGKIAWQLQAKTSGKSPLQSSQWVLLAICVHNVWAYWHIRDDMGPRMRSIIQSPWIQKYSNNRQFVSLGFW